MIADNPPPKNIQAGTPMAEKSQMIADGSICDYPLTNL